KMFDGFNNILEVGCQEGLGTIIVSKAVKSITAIDYYKPHIVSCQERLTGLYDNINFMGFDIIDAPLDCKFDGAFSLDVIEHIDPAQEPDYMKNIADSLNENGVFILGTPSLESQQYASRESQEGHINCQTGVQIKDLCRKYYENVFMFGMNDEVLHTGFLPMAHYIFALCVAPKKFR
ncbi:MAG TPA: class I SAM-dependent methyltransferase, partial [Bacteroidales bacterium]|nr:class I SAM-dependent methyltransferase [Bacteroidales bacterium]